VIPPDLGKLESDTYSICGDIEWRNNIGWSKFTKLFFDSAFIIGVDSDSFITNFLFSKVDL
jgi:hypothetical protein